MITNQRFYYINSRRRTEGTDSHFSYTLPIPQDSKWTHVVVTELVIPKSYYLIEEGRNYFYLIEGTDEFKITIPEGNYSYTSFRSVVIDLLNAQSDHIYDITVPSFNEADTAKYTFDVKGDLPEQVGFRFPEQSNLFEQFGFPEASTVYFTPVSSKHYTLTSANVVKFSIEDALYIRSDICENEHDNVLQQVYVNTGDFASIVWHCPDLLLHAKKLIPRYSNRFEFSLTDEDGWVISLNGLNMNFTLMFFTMIPSVPKPMPMIQAQPTEAKESTS